MTILIDIKYTQEYIDLELPALDYAKPGDKGIDLFAIDNIVLKRNIPQLVRTGVKVAIPDDCVMLLFAKSGRSIEGIGMANGVGVIDPSYRGEIKAPLLYFGSFGHTEIQAGLAIVQFVVMPCPEVICRTTNTLNETERGEGGFGSTRK